ncbi:hypothetical protein SH139x_004224 [Planctomycetaceae bacterium SH139]
MSDTKRRSDPGIAPDISAGNRVCDRLLLDISSDANEEAEQFVECFDTDQQGE